MQLDLSAAAAQTANALSGKVRAQWFGGKVEIDEVYFVGALAHAVAMVMGQNLYRGMRPDGGGMMPGRKKDGRPRGMGSRISRALWAVSIGPTEWLIAAHKEQPGHLERIMGDVELRAPRLETMSTALKRAFQKSVRRLGIGSALGTTGLGAALGGRRMVGGGVGAVFGRGKAARAFQGAWADFGGLGKALGKRPRSLGGALGRRPKRTGIGGALTWSKR